MKTNKRIIATAILATSVIITTNAFAMWNGQWNWMGNWQGKGQWQSMSQNKQSHNPWDLITNIALQDLSEQEKFDLAYQYSEEKLANDLYLHFYELYGVETFKNIATSEAEHMMAVKSLLDRYFLPTPTTYWELQDEFDALKIEGEKWLKEALEVWVKIEMLDIDDIKDTIKSTDNDDIKVIFVNIGGASYNHLRWFAKWLKNNNLTTSIDYSAYLTQEQVNTSWTLKYLLSEKLASEWVVLPSVASSESIKANCAKEEQAKQGQKQGKWQGQGMWNVNWNGYGKNISSERKAKNQEMRGKYKSQIEKSYWKSLQKMSQDRLISLNEKIDSAMLKVEEKTNLSDEIKDKYMAIYNWLKDVVNSFIR